MTEFRILSIKSEGILPRLTDFKKGEISEIRPNVVTSIVKFFNGDIEIDGRRWLLKFLYLFSLYVFEDCMFDSWQIVNSSVMIDFPVFIAISGRRVLKIIANGWNESMSTNNSNSSLRLTEIHLAIISSIWSCLFLYQDNADFDPHADKTCLFVWISFHREHLFDK